MTKPKSQISGVHEHSRILPRHSRIFLAGHRGMVGSAIHRRLQADNYSHIITRSHGELDLINQAAVRHFFENEKINAVILAAAKVGGIHANDTYRAEFIFENLMIQANVIHEAYRSGVQRLLFLGSSCIYPKYAEQPMSEEQLLTGNLESTNEPYAIAKIAGIKLCESYNRQYGTHYRSVMPTNLYGPHDNFDLENSHVLPALIRKFHLAKLARSGDWESIQKDQTLFGPLSDNLQQSLKKSSRTRGSDPGVAGGPKGNFYMLMIWPQPACFCLIRGMMLMRLLVLCPLYMRAGRHTKGTRVRRMPDPKRETECPILMWAAAKIFILRSWLRPCKKSSAMKVLSAGTARCRMAPRANYWIYPA
jgi:hypothetical protein